MKAKLPWILLGISLAFNVCFAVGFFLARPAPPKSLSTRDKAMAMAKKLVGLWKARRAYEKRLEAMRAQFWRMVVLAEEDEG